MRRAMTKSDRSMRVLWDDLLTRVVLCIPYRPRPQDRSHEEYAAWELSSAESVLDQFPPSVRHLGGTVVLDVGCGMGGFTCYLAGHGAAQAIGIDIVQDRIDAAEVFATKREVTNVAFRVEDAAQMSFSDDTFDAIFCFYTFEHVSHPQAVLKELWRVLKPGGTVAMSFPTWYGPWAGHLNALFPVPWLHLLAPEGALVKAWSQRYRALYQSGKIGTGWNPPDALVSVNTVRELAHANAITLAGFENIMGLIPTHPAFYRPRCIKNMQWLLRLPFLRELAVAAVHVAWQK